MRPSQKDSSESQKKKTENTRPFEANTDILVTTENAENKDNKDNTHNTDNTDCTPNTEQLEKTDKKIIIW